MSSKESTESAEPESAEPETEVTGEAEETREAGDAETADAESADTESADTESDSEPADTESDSEPADTETAGAEPGDGSKEKSTGARAGVAIAAALLLACGGLVGYGVLDTEEKPKPRAVPTAEVTYEVTGEGTVDISYLARSEAGTATVVQGATLPWRKTVQVPVGKAPIVAIVLDGKGGQAACTLAIHGTHVQRSTAMGQFGRATCTGELPAAGQ
ncbi:MmpS family transport accessory protein [Streptomyces sp. NPDC096176]|uniref:MmpS family transport accessory protein n=1 Tax=Streptomyces sp. NPDC096176 TaxID=3366079 RepID=UPI0038255EEA